MPACTNEITIALIALVVAITTFIQTMIVYFRSKTLIEALAQTSAMAIQKSENRK